MAVSIDTVYQRVLALANKEQRGYITPQEFNLLANQAQMQIFESYFYTLNHRERAEADAKKETDETDISLLIGQKLSPFHSVEAVTSGTTFPATVGVSGVQYDVFQYGKVFYQSRICTYKPINEVQDLILSKRHVAATSNRYPIWTDPIVSAQDVQIYNGTAVVTSSVTVECYRVPKKANWTYVVVNKKALYNSALAVDFELHKSEEDTLVIKILELAGIVINKPGLVTLAAQKDGAEISTQKI